MRGVLAAVVISALLFALPLGAQDLKASTVAGKTYSVWVSQSFGAPPYQPFQDCAIFTATTMELAGCPGTPGPLLEFPILGVPGMTLWIGFVPCEGATGSPLNLEFIGTSYDGTVIGAANVMGGFGIGIVELTTFGIEGIEDQCPAPTAVSAQNWRKH